MAKGYCPECNTRPGRGKHKRNLCRECLSERRRLKRIHQGETYSPEEERSRQLRVMLYVEVRKRGGRLFE